MTESEGVRSTFFFSIVLLFDRDTHEMSGTVLGVNEQHTASNVSMSVTEALESLLKIPNYILSSDCGFRSLTP